MYKRQGIQWPLRERRRRKTGSASFRHFACNPGNAAGRLSGGELYQSDDITKSIFLFLKTGTISGTNIISITDILCFKQIVVKIPVKSAKMRIAFLRKTDYNVF